MKSKLFYSALLSLLFFNTFIYSQWIRQTNGLPSHWNNTSSIDACNKSTAVIGAYNPYVLKTVDSGNTWVTIPFPAFVTVYGNVTIYEEVVDISIIDKLHFWICTDAVDYLQPQMEVHLGLCSFMILQKQLSLII